MIQLYEILLKAPGVLGARFSGAGFRGCCLAIVESDRAEEAAAYVAAEYEKAQPELVSRIPANRRVLVCEPGDSARVILPDGDRLRWAFGSVRPPNAPLTRVARRLRFLNASFPRWPHEHRCSRDAVVLVASSRHDPPLCSRTNEPYLAADASSLFPRPWAWIQQNTHSPEILYCDVPTTPMIAICTEGTDSLYRPSLCTTCLGRTDSLYRPKDKLTIRSGRAKYDRRFEAKPRSSVPAPTVSIRAMIGPRGDAASRLLHAKPIDGGEEQQQLAGLLGKVMTGTDMTNKRSTRKAFYLERPGKGGGRVLASGLCGRPVGVPPATAIWKQCGRPVNAYIPSATTERPSGREYAACPSLISSDIAAAKPPAADHMHGVAKPRCRSTSAHRPRGPGMIGHRAQTARRSAYSTNSKRRCSGEQLASCRVVGRPIGVRLLLTACHNGPNGLATRWMEAEQVVTCHACTPLTGKRSIPGVPDGGRCGTVRAAADNAQRSAMRQ
ncbi:hypothetical protein HU200_063400 [Digitaria exilis]|uniref:GHMP kinase C-terminal domain-containing protein n=1 Tax=Digitaria exilis TaxID=1010633 RepID=A0A835DWE4_9POAL|nr:hypothetical protein HU200_063400 [Digitaria exilis]